MNKDDTLTPAAFDSFLSWLDADRDQAGKKYNAIQARLIKFFTCRGCIDAEEHADDTINRVIRKVPEIAEGYVGDPALYFYAVARKVFLEIIKKRPPVALPPPIVKQEDIEQEFECLDRCMLQLTDRNRELVLDYYQNEKRAKIEHRKALAEKFGIAQNALRIRAHRIRVILEQCMRGCLQQQIPA